MIDVMRKIWQGGMVEHHGEFFDFPRLQIAPEPTKTVPIYLGGASAPAMKRAATRGDGWIGAGNTPDEVPGILAEFKRLRIEAGRPDEPFETLIGLSTPPDLDTFKRLHDQGMTAGISYPFTFALGMKSSLDDKKRVMEQFAKQFIRAFES